MSNKPLNRIKYLNDNPQLLNSFQQHELYTIKDIIYLNNIELMDICNVHYDSIDNIKYNIIKDILPKTTTVWDLRRQQHNKTYINLSQQIVLPDALNEICSNQYNQHYLNSVVLNITADMALNNNSVMIIDSTDDINIDQVRQYISYKLIDYNNNTTLDQNETTDQVLENVNVKPVHSLKQLHEYVNSNNIELYLFEKKIKLLVVNTITHISRNDLSVDNITRSNMLLDIATKFKYIAEKFDICILCVNEIGSEKAGSLAMLGVSWSHAINTRLVVDSSMLHCIMLH